MKYLHLLSFLFYVGLNNFVFSQRTVWNVHDIKSTSFMIVGHYQDLVDLMGYPDTIIRSKIGVEEISSIEDTNTAKDMRTRYYEIDCLIYNNYLSYIRIGDSVQLEYVFFDKTNINFDYNGYVFNRKTKLKDVLKWLDIDPKSLFYELVNYNQRTVGTNGFGIYTSVNINCYDSIWFVFFSKNSKLWYVRFPYRFDGCIVH